MEVNRMIRVLTKIAEKNSGEDLFIKVYDEAGHLVDPDESGFEFYNDHSDRLMSIDGK